MGNTVSECTSEAIPDFLRQCVQKSSSISSILNDWSGGVLPALHKGDETYIIYSKNPNECKPPGPRESSDPGEQTPFLRAQNALNEASSKAYAKTEAIIEELWAQSATVQTKDKDNSTEER